MNQRPIHILIVEDEPDIREILRDLLECEGFQVQEAATGKQALELILKPTTFDFVLTDYRMPEMDGVALATEIRKLGLSPTPKIYILSGDLDLKNHTVFDGHMVKPFKASEMRQLLRKKSAA